MGREHHEPATATDVEWEISAQPWPNPIADAHWTDGDGVHWHMRGKRGGGAPLSGPALRRLLKLIGLRVLHVYGPQPSEVSNSQREALLVRVDQYFSGQAPPHSGFRLAEFRNDKGEVMLVVQEFC
jgi:hypothetical protein